METNYDHRELLRQLRNGNITPERAGEYWSDEEREKLKLDFYDGVDISEISTSLHRTEMAVVQQLMSTGDLTSFTTRRGRGSRKPMCTCGRCPVHHV